MVEILFMESRLLAEELYLLLQALDPARARRELDTALRERVQRLAARFREIPETLGVQEGGDSRLRRLHERVRALGPLIEEMRARFSESAVREGDDRTQLRERLQALYAAIAASLENHAIDVPDLRPTNRSRSIFHISSGLVALVFLQHLLAGPALVWVAVGFAGMCWTLEGLRRLDPAINVFLMRVLERIAHPHEHHRVNSATWYATALVVLAAYAPPLAASVGVMVLAIADPAASWVGRRYGRTRIAGQRTLEGSAAFLIAGVLVSSVVILIYGSPTNVPALIGLSCIAGVSGALTELLSGRLDDNFTIPLIVTLAVALGVTG